MRHEGGGLPAEMGHFTKILMFGGRARAMALGVKDKSNGPACTRFPLSLY